MQPFFFLFGAFTIAGGIMGYIKAKSVPSLVAGAVSGTLLLVAAWLMGTPNSRIGVVLAAVVAFALGGRFIPAYLKSRKLMPAGIMAGLSTVAVALAILGLVQR